MSIGQFFCKVGRGEESLEETVERLEMAPTADVANRTREAMAEVMRVARTSRNLQGSFVRILKQAAVTGAASAEVLRTRADSNEPESEILRQLQTMRLELDSTKREAQAAKEEANALRKKIAEMEVQQKRHRSTVTVPMVEDIQGEAEDTGEGAPKILEFDDARRRREILPPQSEWPTTYRPALRGKVKVLEDRPLTGSKIRLADNKERSATRKNTKEAKQGGAQSLMGQIAPLLEDWLKKNLLSLGFSGRTGEGGNRDPAPSKKKKKKSEPRDIGTRKGGKYTTTVPSSQLFNAVVGGKRNALHLRRHRTGDRTHPTDPRLHRPPKEPGLRW